MSGTEATSRPRRVAVFDLNGYATSMPALTSLIECLNGDGIGVDAFTTAETAAEINAGLYGDCRGFPSTCLLQAYGAYRFVPRGRLAAAHGLRFHVKGAYRALIGVDARGVQTACAFGRFVGAPVLLYSFHIRPRALAAGADGGAIPEASCRFAITQDETRASLLAEHEGVPPGKIRLLPNAPMGPPRRAKAWYFHEKFGLSRETRIALFSGSFCDGHGIHDIVSSLAGWPAGWALVLHCRYDFQKSPDKAFAMRLLRTLAPPDRVFLSDRTFPYRDVRTVFDSADASFALYNEVEGAYSTAMNNRFVGHASAKFASALHAGLPVIVNGYSNLAAIVRRTGCGLVAEQPRDIGPALDAIAAKGDAFSERALATFRDEFDFAAAYRRLAAEAFA